MSSLNLWFGIQNRENWYPMILSSNVLNLLNQKQMIYDILKYNDFYKNSWIPNLKL